MTMRGTVRVVELTVPETRLVGLHVQGSCALTVDNTAGFEGAGTLTITPPGVAPSVFTVDYLLALDGGDPGSGVAADTFVLKAPTTVAIADGSTVQASADQATAIGHVDLGDGSTIPAVIAHPLVGLIEEAVDSRVPVVVEKRHGAWTVTEVDHRTPVLDGQVLDPTKPVTPGAVTTSLDTYPDAYAARIKADFLQAGQLTADVALLGEILAGGPGQGSVSTSGQGIVTKQPDGTPRTILSTDPTQPDMFRGVADFDRGSVRNGFALSGLSTVEPGGVLQLRSGITAPTLPPTLTTSWPSQTIAFPASLSPAHRHGLALKSLTEGYTVRKNGDLIVFNPTTGALVADHVAVPTTADVIAGVGYAAVAGQIVLLERWPDGYRVRRYTLSGTMLTFVSEWTVPLLDPLLDGAAIAVGKTIGTDLVYVAQSRNDGKVDLHTYSIAGVWSASITTTTAVTNNHRPIAGLAVQAAAGTATVAYYGGQLDANGYAVLLSQFASGSGAILTPLWAANGDPLPGGLTLLADDLLPSRIWYLSRASNQLAQHWPAGSTLPYWVQAAWYDTATGTETLPGPYQQVARIPGSSSTVSMGQIPAGANAVALYMGTGATQPPRTGMWRQNPVPVAGASSVTVFDPATSGANPLATATLIGGVAAKITSDAGVTLLDSTGYVAGGGGGGAPTLAIVGGGSPTESGWGVVDCGSPTSNGTLDTIAGGAP